MCSLYTKSFKYDKIVVGGSKIIMDDCLFCKIARKEVKSHILYEDEDLLVFLDLDQNPSGHTLVIPKKHITDVNELDHDTLIKIFDVAKEMQNTLMTKLHKKASSLNFNYGDAQVIKHVHLHILPHNFHEKSHLSEEEVYKLLKDE